MKMSALQDDNSVVLTEFQLEAIEQLRGLINNDYSHINIQQDINFLTKYLYANDWDAEEAVKRIVYTYRLKKDFPAWFALKKVSDYLPFIYTHSRCMLADRDKNGKRVFVYKAEKLGVPGMNLRICAQLDDMWYDAMLMDRSTQNNGITVIVDCKNVPKSLIKWLIPRDLKVSSERTNIFPCKNLEIHVVNLSSLFNIALKAIMPMLSDKVKSKFHFHQNDWTKLHSLVGKDCLPEEFGGMPGKIIDFDKSYQFLLGKETILQANMRYGIL